MAGSIPTWCWSAAAIPTFPVAALPYNMKTERKVPPIQVLQDLADQLVQKGLKFVDGDVVADDSYFVFERYGEGWSQDDLVWEWGAPSRRSPSTTT